MTMDTHFIRHSWKFDIDDATRQKVCNEQRIGLHYPHYKGKNGRKILGSRPDNSSLDPDDYPRNGRTAMRGLTQLATDGGYVYAEYFGQAKALVGYVKPKSKIELFRGKWGTLNESEGSRAILKTIRVRKVKIVRASDHAVTLVGRPRQGTIIRWKRAGKAIENMVEGRRSLAALSDLSPDQQEILCSEFLRSRSTAEQLGLPRLAHLILPVGRTMRDIDICGLGHSGEQLHVLFKWSVNFISPSPA
jgi:hypothetical protein